MKTGPRKRELIWFTIKQVADILAVSVRTVEQSIARWSCMQRAVKDPNLPSTPTNGLRSARVSRRLRRISANDLNEYSINIDRENVGLKPVSLRKGERP